MKKSLAALLDAATPVVAMAGMVIPPWNLFWWALAYVFLGRQAEDDASGDVGLAVLFAPGLAATLPLHLLSSLLRR